MIYRLQLLRFLSAFSILLLHLILFGNNKYALNTPYLNFITDYLMIGVDIFFIISGFIMMHTSRSQNTYPIKLKLIEIKKFYLKRISRIYPVWWLLCLILLPVLLIKPEWINSSVDVPTSFWHSLFLIPHESVPLIMVGWTLEFEIYFYLIFGLTLLFSPKIQFLTIISLFVTMILSANFLNLFLPEAYVNLITSPLLLYFTIGMALSFIYKKVEFGYYQLAGVICGFILSCLYLASFNVGEIERFYHFAPTATFIVCLFLLWEKKTPAKFPKFYKWGGNISYSLYLIHILVISAVGRLLIHFNVNETISPLFSLLLIVVISIVGSSVLYYGFEKPALKLFRKKVI